MKYKKSSGVKNFRRPYKRQEARRSTDNGGFWMRTQLAITLVVSIVTCVITVSNGRVFTEWFFKPEVVVSNDGPTPAILDTMINGKREFQIIAVYYAKNVGRVVAKNIRIHACARYGSHIGVNSFSDAVLSDTVDLGSGKMEFVVNIPELAPSEVCAIFMADFVVPSPAWIEGFRNGTLDPREQVPCVIGGKFNDGVVNVISGWFMAHKRPHIRYVSTDSLDH